MILVTGATGNYGKLTIDFLLKKGVAASNISALVRDVAKAQDLANKGITLKIGDYDHYDSLVKAFEGVEKLLLVSGSDIEKRGKQHENAVKAAKEAGVKHIVYTSFQRVNTTETSPIFAVAKSHIDTENLIKASGMTYSIQKNNLYADVIPMFIGDKFTETGIFFPAGQTKGAFATREDMAEATAEILKSESQSKEYAFANVESVSFEDVAQILSEIFATNIVYHNPSAAIFAETLTKFRVPQEIIGMSIGFGGAISEGEFAAISTDLEKLLGRKPTTVKQYLTQLFAK